MEPALRIENLVKIYSNHFYAIKNLSFTVQQGDFFALLGPNGAGKSTTIEMISSLIRPNSGSIKVFGVDLHKHPVQAKYLLGIVPQEFNFNNFYTVKETLIYQATFYGLKPCRSKQQVERYLSSLDLESKANEIVHTLSGGTKRRLMIARALMHSPKLLLLDEPTAGIDIQTRHKMWECLQKLNQDGTTIILTTHYLEEAQKLARNIVIINHGEVIAAMSMRELLQQIDGQRFVFEASEIISESQLEALCARGHKFYREKDSGGYSLILDLYKHQSLNSILEQFISYDVKLVSIQPQNSQLETLFMQKTQKTLQ